MKKASRVKEPVQVYLEIEDARRLQRLAQRLDATKSDVLRRGLAALEDQLTDQSPLIRLLAVADAEEDKGPPVDYDVAVEHDRAIAEHVDRQTEERWREIDAARKRRRTRRG